MPLPWKKKKKSGGGGTGDRISRLMADFQSPSKHGGSLVVETGFPNFLIDIFVKNRDRMNKSVKRSKREKRQTQQKGQNIKIEESPTVSSDDDREVLTTSTASVADVDRASSNRSHIFAEEQGEEERGLDGADSQSIDLSADLLDHSPDRFPSLFLSIPMVVVLGLLAMFTKWLVMGATIAAFLLVLAEFILGAPVADSLKPCIHGGASFRGLVQNAWSSRKSKPKINRDSPSNSDPIKSVSTGLKQVSEEIKVSISESRVPAASQVEDGLIPTADVEYQEQAVRRSELRSTILKKIVPKKIRHHRGGEGDGAWSR